MYALNILARALVAVVGLSIALGMLAVGDFGSPLQETFGGVVFLFGLYRLVSYIYRSRQHEDDE